MSKIPPIIISPEKGLHSKHYSAGLPLLALFELPGGAEPGAALTFYCDSVAKENSGYVCVKDEEHPEGYCYQHGDNSGDGSSANPWKDLNYALRELSCIAGLLCGDCPHITLVLTGTVNYQISSVDGYSAITVECSGAKFAPNIDLYDLYEEHPDVFEGMYWYQFHGIRGVNFENVYFEGDSHFNLQYFYLFYRCFFCNVTFSKFEYRQHEITLKDDDDELKYYTSGNAIFFFDCGSCTFSSIEGAIIEMDYYTTRLIEVFFVDYNLCCDFSFPSVSIDIRETHKPASLFIGNVNCYYNNRCCTFDNCNTSMSVSLNSEREEPDKDDYIEGCGFYANAGTNWKGTNSGYCRWRDDEEETAKYDSGCTTNANCAIFPSVSSGSSLCDPCPSSCPNAGSSSGGGGSGSITPPIPGSSSTPTPSSSTPTPGSSSTPTPSSSTPTPGSSTTPTPESSSTPASSSSLGSGFVRAYITYRHFAIKTTSYWETHTEEGEELPEPRFELIVWFNAVNLDKIPSVATSYGEINTPNAEITRYWNGEYIPVPSSDGFFVGGSPDHGNGTVFTGWREWYISRQEMTDLISDEQRFLCESKYRLDWYSIWGDSACTAGDVTFEVMIPTITFTWETNEGTATPPEKVILQDEYGEKYLLDFNVEHFLVPDILPSLDDALLAFCSGKYSPAIPSVAVGRGHNQTIDDFKHHYYTFFGVK